MTDLIPAPRPVPTTEDRMRDARTDTAFHRLGQQAAAVIQPAASFATYLDRTERDQLDARAASAEQERDEALDELRDSRADRKHKSDLLLATARALDMLPGDLVDDTPAVAGRLRAELDEALDARNVLRQQLDAAKADRDAYGQVANFRQGVIDRHRQELGAAGEVLAVVRDAVERIDRALARYDTQPGESGDLREIRATNATLAVALHNDALAHRAFQDQIERYADQLRDNAKTAEDGIAVGLLRAADGLGDLLSSTALPPGLGSPSPRAQDARCKCPAGLCRCRNHEDELAAEVVRLGDALDQIGAAVEAGAGDIRPGIRSILRRARPEAINLWAPLAALRAQEAPPCRGCHACSGGPAEREG